MSEPYRNNSLTSKRPSAKRFVWATISKLAKSLGVTTRIDVLRSATQQLMDTAASTQTYSSQFRMALYDFGGSSQGLRLVHAVVEPFERQDGRRQYRPDDRQRPERQW